MQQCVKSTEEYALFSGHPDNRVYNAKVALLHWFEDSNVLEPVYSETAELIQDVLIGARIDQLDDEDLVPGLDDVIFNNLFDHFNNTRASRDVALVGRETDRLIPGMRLYPHSLNGRT